MRTFFILLFALLSIKSAQSQSFLFEDSTVPTAWTTSNGTLSLSTEHFKDGTQSLCWETAGSSVMDVSFTSFIANNGNSTFMQIYSPNLSNDTLKVEFLYFATVKRTAIFLCNYKGWREFNRAYSEYASTLSSSISSVRITLKPTTTENRRIYFDNINFNFTTESTRIIGSQWLLDKRYFTSGNSSLALFANPVDLPVVSATAKELSDLNALRLTLRRSPTSGTAAALAAAKSYAQSLNIVRNLDGSVCGNVVNTSAASLTTSFMTDISSKLELLAAAGLTDASTMSLFRDLLDHLLDQGIAEGCNFALASNDYTPSRTIPANFLDILPACTAEEKVEVLKLVRWISFYGMMYFPSDSYLANQVSDVIYLFTPHIMGVALFQPDDATAVRELKVFKRFLDRNTEYVPGGGDILKPDGTGFHHNTNYNNYMYSYKTWTEYMYYLRGTEFKIAIDSYQRFKKAVISVYTMATLDTGDSRYFANSLSGRNPYAAGGVNLQFSKNLFDQLILVGSDCLGTPDTELTAAYNFFFKTTKYVVPAKSYEGFYQFNYSPIGVYRKANWVATMRAPTTKFFGAEIYSATNRFGRYQSHGSLEIMYSGTLATSGCPTNATGGGWNWNVVPGTTTVHYTSWQEMMPNKTTTDRFDQFSKTKNFSGALSFGDCGIFATDFDQIETWGSQKFTPTNLVFKKSVFAFDNMLISLGSNISSSGTYSTSMITATNLFQNILTGSSGNFILNGSTIAKPNTSTVATTVDNWMITPQGTGYFIPKGNDPLEIRFNDQTTPGQNGADYAAPTTTASAALAYLNHGLKPSSRNYSFVVVPATNSASMQSLATEMANGGGIVYQIQAQNSSLHALTYLPTNTTAYSFFGAVSNLTFGIVKANTGESLLMDKFDVQSNQHHFAVCNPNLKPTNDATYDWVASPSQTTITLKGEWYPANPVSAVVFSAPVNNETQVTITLSGGEPVYFDAKTLNDKTALCSISTADWLQLSTDNENLHLHFIEPQKEQVTVQLFALDGKMLYSKKAENLNSNMDISVSKFGRGLYFCFVRAGMQTKIFKWMR